MLGERRSKGAFYEGFGEGVREEKEALESASVQLPEHDKGLPVEMLPDPDAHIGSQEKRKRKNRKLDPMRMTAMFLPKGQSAACRPRICSSHPAGRTGNFRMC